MPRQNPTVDGNRTAELWVRADVPLGADERQHRLYQRASSLDTFEDVTPRLVPSRLSLSGIAAETPEGNELRNDIVDARRWANDEGVDVEPYLSVCEESSMIDGSTQRVLTFPSTALVEYEADAIATVTPHADGDRVVSVEARLEQLADHQDRTVVVAES